MSDEARAPGAFERAGEGLTVTLRLRLSTHDAHYGGQLVDGARLLGLFGDVATELLIRLDGDEGLFRAYDAVEFLAPVYAGDYVEAWGQITRVGRTSRAMRFEARKVIRGVPELGPSAAEVVAPALVVCRASGTCVTPVEKQRSAR
jgi:3-aminobutyryl-CoA ammonia-lyase